MKCYFTACPADADSAVLAIKSGVIDMRLFTMDGFLAALHNLVDRANQCSVGKKLTEY